MHCCVLRARGSARVRCARLVAPEALLYAVWGAGGRWWVTWGRRGQAVAKAVNATHLKQLLADGAPRGSHRRSASASGLALVPTQALPTEGTLRAAAGVQLRQAAKQFLKARRLRHSASVRSPARPLHLRLLRAPL